MRQQSEATGAAPGQDDLFESLSPTNDPHDALDFSLLPTSAGVTIDLASSAVQAVAGSSRTFVLHDPLAFEGSVGTQFADNLTGNDRDNVLVGGAGDTLSGNGGSDLLQGGSTQVVFLDFDTETNGAESDRPYSMPERDDIQQRLENLYAPFTVDFTRSVTGRAPQ